MFKKIILVLALIGIIVLTAYGALSGTYTTNRYFYRPGYGSYGLEEYNAYNAAMQVADTQIEANKDAIAGGATELSELSDVNTSTPTDRFVLIADGVDFESRAIVEADISDLGTYLVGIVDDTDPDLGGELDAGAHNIGFTLQSTTGDGTTTIDWRLGNKFKFTFGAQNETFTFTAPTNPCTLMLTIIQDGTGSRTITWPATCKWPGGTEATLSTAANARDKVALDWDGTQYDCQIAKDFK